MNEYVQEKTSAKIVSDDESLPANEQPSWIPFLDIAPKLSVPDVIRLIICIVEQHDHADLEASKIFVSSVTNELKISKTAAESEIHNISKVGKLLVYSLCRGNLAIDQINVEQWISVRNRLKSCGINAGLSKIAKRCLSVDKDSYRSLEQVKCDLQQADPFRADSDNKMIYLALAIAMTMAITMCCIYANREEPLVNEHVPRPSTVTMPKVKSTVKKAPGWLKQVRPGNCGWRVRCKANSFGEIFVPMTRNYFNRISEIRHYRTGKCLYRSSTPLTPGELVQKAILDRVDLSGATFARMNLTDVDFRGVTISNARFFRSELGDMSNCIFRNCCFEEIAGNRFHNAEFLNSEFKTCHLVLAHFENSRFKNSTIDESTLRHANFSGSTFEGSKISNSDAIMSKFENCKFVGMGLEQVDFQPSYFRKSFFVKCKAKNCIFAYCRFREFDAVDTVFEQCWFTHPLSE